MGIEGLNMSNTKIEYKQVPATHAIKIDTECENFVLFSSDKGIDLDVEQRLVTYTNLWGGISVFYFPSSVLSVDIMEIKK
jgi:hypothetical protein